MYQTSANLRRGRVRTAFAPVSAALIALLLLTFGLSTPAAAESVVLPAATVEQFEEELFILTNEARAKGQLVRQHVVPARSAAALRQPVGQRLTSARGRHRGARFLHLAGARSTHQPGRFDPR